MDEKARDATAGVLARGVTSQITPPLRQLRDQLAEIVKSLDTHIANARGPEALSWERVHQLRATMTESYLGVRKVVRLSTDLLEILKWQDPPKTCDINNEIDTVRHLVCHRLPAHVTVTTDYCSCDAGVISSAVTRLCIAQMLLSLGDIFTRYQGSSLHISTVLCAEVSAVDLVMKTDIQCADVSIWTELDATLLALTGEDNTIQVEPGELCWRLFMR